MKIKIYENKKNKYNGVFGIKENNYTYLIMRDMVPGGWLVIHTISDEDKILKQKVYFKEDKIYKWNVFKEKPEFFSMGEKDIPVPSRDAYKQNKLQEFSTYLKILLSDMKYGMRKNITS